MSYFAASLFFFFAYVVCAILLCGDLTAPLSDIAGHDLNSVWMLFFFGSLLVAAFVASPLITRGVLPEFRPALFIVVWMCLSATSAGIYATRQLDTAITDFHADKVIQNSFFESLHEVPREFNLYVHAAVMKDCHPYYWSYRWLTFIPLDTDIAVNVLPQEWLDACKIKRT